MLKVLDQQPDIHAVIARAMSPWVVARALVSFEEKDLAKARRYMWENIGTEKYPKQWGKKIKQMDFASEVLEAPFKIAVM
jgi:hypothetical protein